MLLFIWRGHRFPCVLQGFAWAAHGHGGMIPAKWLLGWHQAGGAQERSRGPPGLSSQAALAVSGCRRGEQSHGAAPLPSGSVAAGRWPWTTRSELGLGGCCPSHRRIPVPGGWALGVRRSVLPSPSPPAPRPPFLPAPPAPAHRAPKGALGMLCELQLK